MKRIDVTETIFIEILRTDEIDDPLVFIISDAIPKTFEILGLPTEGERQVVAVFADEIRDMIAALTEAVVYLADQVGE